MNKTNDGNTHVLSVDTMGLLWLGLTIGFTLLFPFIIGEKIQVRGFGFALNNSLNSRNLKEHEDVGCCYGVFLSHCSV